MRPLVAGLAVAASPASAPSAEPRRMAAPAPWWERRAFTRRVVGGCPDHWWKPTARRTAACTCPAY